MDTKLDFSIIEEKILETSQLLSSLQDKSEELRKLQEVYIEVNNNYDVIKNENYSLTLENERLSYKLQLCETKFANLEVAHDQLKTSHDQLLSEYHTNINSLHIKHQSVSAEISRYQSICKCDLKPDQMQSKGSKEQENELKIAELEKQCNKLSRQLKNAKCANSVELSTLLEDITKLEQKLKVCQGTHEIEISILKEENGKLKAEMDSRSLTKKHFDNSEDELKHLKSLLEQKNGVSNLNIFNGFKTNGLKLLINKMDEDKSKYPTKEKDSIKCLQGGEELTNRKMYEEKLKEIKEQKDKALENLSMCFQSGNSLLDRVLEENLKLKCELRQLQMENSVKSSRLKVEVGVQVNIDMNGLSKFHSIPLNHVSKNTVKDTTMELDSATQTEEHDLIMNACSKEDEFVLENELITNPDAAHIETEEHDSIMNACSRESGFILENNITNPGAADTHANDVLLINTCSREDKLVLENKIITNPEDAVDCPNQFSDSDESVHEILEIMTYLPPLLSDLSDDADGNSTSYSSESSSGSNTKQLNTVDNLSSKKLVFESSLKDQKVDPVENCHTNQTRTEVQYSDTVEYTSDIVVCSKNIKKIELLNSDTFEEPILCHSKENKNKSHTRCDIEKISSVVSDVQDINVGERLNENLDTSPDDTSIDIAENVIPTEKLVCEKGETNHGNQCLLEKIESGSIEEMATVACASLTFTLENNLIEDEDTESKKLDPKLQKLQVPFETEVAGGSDTFAVNNSTSTKPKLGSMFDSLSDDEEQLKELNNLININSGSEHIDLINQDLHLSETTEDEEGIGLGSPNTSPIKNNRFQVTNSVRYNNFQKVIGTVEEADKSIKENQLSLDKKVPSYIMDKENKIILTKRSTIPFSDELLEAPEKSYDSESQQKIESSYTEFQKIATLDFSINMTNDSKRQHNFNRKNNGSNRDFGLVEVTSQFGIEKDREIMPNKKGTEINSFSVTTDVTNSKNGMKKINSKDGQCNGLKNGIISSFSKLNHIINVNKIENTSVLSNFTRKTEQNQTNEFCSVSQLEGRSKGNLTTENPNCIEKDIIYTDKENRLEFNSIEVGEIKTCNKNDELSFDEDAEKCINDKTEIIRSAAKQKKTTPKKLNQQAVIENQNEPYGQQKKNEIGIPDTKDITIEKKETEMCNDKGLQERLLRSRTVLYSNEISVRNSLTPNLSHTTTENEEAEDESSLYRRVLRNPQTLCAVKRKLSNSSSQNKNQCTKNEKETNTKHRENVTSSKKRSYLQKTSFRKLRKHCSKEEIKDSSSEESDFSEEEFCSPPKRIHKAMKSSNGSFQVEKQVTETENLSPGESASREEENSPSPNNHNASCKEEISLSPNNLQASCREEILPRVDSNKALCQTSSFIPKSNKTLCEEKSSPSPNRQKASCEEKSSLHPNDHKASCEENSSLHPNDHKAVCEENSSLHPNGYKALCEEDSSSTPKSNKASYGKLISSSPNSHKASCQKENSPSTNTHKMSESVEQCRYSGEQGTITEVLDSSSYKSGSDGDDCCSGLRMPKVTKSPRKRVDFKKQKSTLEDSSLDRITPEKEECYLGERVSSETVHQPLKSSVSIGWSGRQGNTVGYATLNGSAPTDEEICSSLKIFNTTKLLDKRLRPNKQKTLIESSSISDTYHKILSRIKKTNSQQNNFNPYLENKFDEINKDLQKKRRIAHQNRKCLNISKSAPNTTKSVENMSEHPASRGCSLNSDENSQWQPRNNTKLDSFSLSETKSNPDCDVLGSILLAQSKMNYSYKTSSSAVNKACTSNVYNEESSVLDSHLPHLDSAGTSNHCNFFNSGSYNQHGMFNLNSANNIELPVHEADYKKSHTSSITNIHNENTNVPSSFSNLVSKKQSVKRKKEPPLTRGKCKFLFQKLLNYSKDETALEEVCNEFLSQNPKYIAKLILDKIVNDLDKADTKYAPAPLMTDRQRVMLGFMYKLEDMSDMDLMNNYLLLAEQHLLLKPNLQYIEPITRLYVAICKLRKDINRIRRFCCETLYFMENYAVPFLFTVLTSWTEVLPHMNECSDYLLAKVIVQLVLSKDCNKPGFNFLPLRDLLNKYYGYPIQKWDVDEIMQEIMDEFLRNPVRLSDFTILLYCKNQPSKWVYNAIEKHLKPLVIKVPLDNNKATVIILIGNIVSQFKLDEDHEYIESIENWLEELSHGTSSDIVLRSINLSLSRLPQYHAE